MALCHYAFMTRYCLRSIMYIARKYTNKTSSRNVQKDLFEVYSEHVLQEKSYRWNEFIFKMTPVNIKTSDSFKVNRESKELFRSCTQEELVTKILDYITENDVNNVVVVLEMCKEKSVILSPGLMLYLLKLLAKLGHKEGLVIMLDYFKSVNVTEYNNKCGFKYYTAQVLWCNGKGEESLLIMEDFYKNNILRHEVNCVMYDIISDAVTKRGEVSLNLVTNFVQKIVKNYKNVYPMAILFKHLCGSEWFADQQLAKKLLEENDELLDVVMPLIPLWCVQHIQYHRIDVVQRLCEILLQYNSLEYYSSVLHNLFDYYYNQQNLKQCSAIVRSSLDLQMPLKDSYQKRFIVLLTTGRCEKSHHNSTKIPKSIENQINLKF